MLCKDAEPVTVEGTEGRPIFLVPGDVFFATPGHRESTRWVVGGVPRRGLRPGRSYWILSDSGVVGDLFGESPIQKNYVGQVRYIGVALGNDGQRLNIRDFAASAPKDAADLGASVFLVIGTSAEVGKTTAGVAVLRRLRQKGHATVAALKATGTSSLAEIMTYRDFGASYAFDCIDFGLPTTYPSDRQGIDNVFGNALNVCLSLPVDAVIVECGGDMLGANVPAFFSCLRRRRATPNVILVAADAVGAYGGVEMLKKIGLRVKFITGPCTDTPTVQQRTQAVCRVTAVNMAKSEALDAVFRFDRLRRQYPP
jgi:hypothetical protein